MRKNRLLTALVQRISKHYRTGSKHWTLVIDLLKQLDMFSRSVGTLPKFRGVQYLEPVC